MSPISKQLLEHLSIVDEYARFNNITGNSLPSLMEEFANSINADGTIPYLLGMNERFRASPLASAIIWLDGQGLLPITALDKMQDGLIFLRDNNIQNDSNAGETSKKSEDNDGWSLGEGVSVWSTSMAIIALLDSRGNGMKKAMAFKKSILWLARQKNITHKGWGYQNCKNCEANPVMTALALRALALVLDKKNRASFGFTDDELNTINESIISGYEYLEKNIFKKGNKSYWEFCKQPHCAATVWGVLALKQMSKIEHPRSSDFASFYKNNINSALVFILSKIPSKTVKWENEQFVNESGAKYNKQKNYHSFSATLIPQLFELGVSPFETKIINQIKWLIKNQNEWKTLDYDKEHPCSFTHAMIVSVLCAWSNKVGAVHCVQILQDTKGMLQKGLSLIWGFNHEYKATAQLVLKQRLWLFFSLFVSVISIVLLREHAIKLLKALITCIPNINSEVMSVVTLNLISDAIFFPFTFGASFLLGWILRKWGK